METVVGERIGDLYRRAVEVLTEPVLEKAALPVLESWRQGNIKRLVDVDARMQEEITTYLKSDEAAELLAGPTQSWLRGIAGEIEKDTVPLCVRNGVPVQQLSLSSYLALPDMKIDVSAGDVFAVHEITLLIDAVISVLVGMLCGGSGIALVASGLPGIAAGVVVSFALLLLGKGQMEKVVLRANIPVPVRKLIPKGYFKSRLGNIAGRVKEELLGNLTGEKARVLSESLTNEISGQIEQCLMKMAEVVEIPL